MERDYVPSKQFLPPLVKIDFGHPVQNPIIVDLIVKDEDKKCQETAKVTASKVALVMADAG
jgi:hypothetical protein